MIHVKWYHVSDHLYPGTLDLYNGLYITLLTTNQYKCSFALHISNELY